MCIPSSPHAPRPPEVPAAAPCLHCGRRAGQRDRRRLCKPCWRDRAVRGLYPASKRANRFAHADAPPGRDRPLPKRPTAARPGGAHKRGVLRFRAARNLALHHPYDERITPAPSALLRARRLFAMMTGLNRRDVE